MNFDVKLLKLNIYICADEVFVFNNSSLEPSCKPSMPNTPEQDNTNTVAVAAIAAPERASIKINDIPTELLERILGKYVRQVNNNFKKTQGEIEVNDLVPPRQITQEEVNLIRAKRRSIAQVNASYARETDYQNRLEYVNEHLPLYGFEPQEIITKQTRTDEPIANVLKISVAEIMKLSIQNNHNCKDNDIHITNDSLKMMTDFAAQFFHLFTKRLHRLKEIQRRILPNRDDLNLLVNEGYVDIKGLNEMYYTTKDFIKKTKMKNNDILNQIDQKSKIAILSFTDHDNGMFNKVNDVINDVVEEQPWWIDQIVHRKKRKVYIPEWMPPLPPDHTFKSTPKYSQRTTNPVILREKLVKEGRFGEKALDHIIIREDNSLCSPISGDESISSESGNDEGENEQPKELELISRLGTKSNGEDKTKIVESTDSIKLSSQAITEPAVDKEDINVEKKTDLVKLARNRIAFLDKRRKEEEERLTSRLQSDESKFGKNFGFYTNIKKLPEDIKEELQEYRDTKLKKLVNDLAQQEKKYIQWSIEQEELRKKIDEEKSKYAEANVIHIGNLGNGNPDDHNLAFYNDDDDDEVEFDIEFSDMEEVENINEDNTNKILEGTEAEINNNDTVNIDNSIADESSSKLPDITFEDFDKNHVRSPNVDNTNAEDDKVLSVRFNDQISTSVISNNDDDDFFENSNFENDLNDQIEEEIEEEIEKDNKESISENKSLLNNIRDKNVTADEVEDDFEMEDFNEEDFEDVANADVDDEEKEGNHSISKL